MDGNRKTEYEIDTVLVHQQKQLESISFAKPDDKLIGETENLLEELGYSLPAETIAIEKAARKQIMIPTWSELYSAACEDVGDNHYLEELFTGEELREKHDYLRVLAQDYNALHRLDLIDYSISAFAGIVSAAVEILLVGIPEKTPDGLKAGKLSDFIRSQFEKRFPPDEMEKLANSPASKVSYDAQDNRNTTINVEGLSSYYHRMLSVGHDPFLGFIVGVFDILTGRMTTIDKSGRIVSQIMENYADRRETDVFKAIAKEFIHLKSDITTSMGLPAPLMSLFNLFQFKSVIDEEQTVAEIVQGMYYEGYDFIHFCSESIPVMISEVIIRISYAVKSIKSGRSIRESIPISTDREKHPKLATMLFIGHASATAINAGRVYFTKNPMAINYPQWLKFAKYTYKQLKWALIEKPEMRDRYIQGIIDKEMLSTFDSIDMTMANFEEDFLFVLSE